jgi:hypothetical protein
VYEMQQTKNAISIVFALVGFVVVLTALGMSTVRTFAGTAVIYSSPLEIVPSGPSLETCPATVCFISSPSLVIITPPVWRSYDLEYSRRCQAYDGSKIAYCKFPRRYPSK